MEIIPTVSLQIFVHDTNIFNFSVENDLKKSSSVEYSTLNPDASTKSFILNSTFRPRGAFPEGPSIFSFILIMICTTAGATVLMVIGCAAMCICSERKRKRGKIL